MNGTSFHNVVVLKGTIIIQLLPCKDEPLCVRGCTARVPCYSFQAWDKHSTHLAPGLFPIPREPPELGGWPFSRQLGVLLECQQEPSCLVLIKRPWIMANDVVGEAHAQLVVDLRINFQAGGEPGCITATVAPPWILAAWSTRTTVQLEPKHLESPSFHHEQDGTHTHIYIYIFLVFPPS